MPHQLFCIIRKRWIKTTPEELVRQTLLNHLINKLGFPPDQIIIEKGLDCFSHLDPALLSTFPMRRIDLLIVAKDLHPIHSYYPLILIECKATPITSRAIRQVLGYNHFLRACFVALANQKEVRLGWLDSQQNLSLSKHIPSYVTLLEHAKKMMNPNR